jgi:hypothetical protein
MTPLAHNQLITTAKLDGIQHALGGLHWASVDEGTDGSVRFLNTVEITGRNMRDMPRAAFYRLACYLLLSQFDEKSLADASQSLTDIYSWQLDRNAAPPPALLPMQPLPPKRVREAERVPFILEE